MPTSNLCPDDGGRRHVSSFQQADDDESRAARERRTTRKILAKNVLLGNTCNVETCLSAVQANEAGGLSICQQADASVCRTAAVADADDDRRRDGTMNAACEDGAP